MSHWRSDLRAALRTAISGDPGFAEYGNRRAIAESVDPDECPFFVVRTPQERSRPDGPGTFERDTDVVLHFRRMGGAELEDDLDVDAEAVEALALTVLNAVGHDAALSLTTLNVRDAGSRKLGELDMQFTVTRVEGDCP